MVHYLRSALKRSVTCKWCIICAPFLAYVKKRLDSHALDLLDEEEDLDNRKYVFTDFQDDFEREHKKHEFEHLKTP